MSLLSPDVTQMIGQYGYGAVALAVGIESIGIPFPGETMLIAAAVYAGSTHQLSVTLVVVAAAAGAIMGDNIGFWIGREFGFRFLLRYGRYVRVTEPRIKLGQYLFLRHGGKVVFFGRFVAVLRALAAVLAGTNRMSWLRFLAFNAAGGIAWATIYGVGADPGSSPIYTVEGPVFDGVSAYAIQTEVGSAWSAPFIAQPGALTVLTVPADAVVFEPLDAYGNPVAVSGNVAVGLGFASGAQGGVTFAEQAAITPATVGVYRFFDTGDGTHFFTADSAERDQLLATRPDLTYEGVGLDAVSLSAADPNAEPVYRFFSTADGTHFFTSSTSERDSVEANRLDLTYEGVGFYEDRTQQSGDSAVYRFFDTIHGTHLYTSDESERASIVQSRPDLTLEGVGFYAPHG